MRNADVQKNVNVEQRGYTKVSVGRGEPVGIPLKGKTNFVDQRANATDVFERSCFMRKPEEQRKLQVEYKQVTSMRKRRTV